MRPLNPKQTAERIGWSVRSLERARVEGNGPAFVRIGKRRVGYLAEDVDAWLKASRFQHRAEELAAGKGRTAPPAGGAAA